MPLMNPFARRDVQDHSGVVIPISEARGRASTETEMKAESEVKSKDDGSVASGSAGGFSIEHLRMEVESDVAIEGHDTAYDRMYHTPP